MSSIGLAVESANSLVGPQASPAAAHSPPSPSRAQAVNEQMPFPSSDGSLRSALDWLTEVFTCDTA